MTFLHKHNSTYNPLVVNALAECIHILPTGSCVDLSDGEKALVLEENAADFTRPMILKFSNNVIYDLSDPIISKSLHIIDIMKTMDNRIAIDEETLKHFVADKYIQETAERFRRRKLEIAQRKQQELQQQTMDALLADTSFLADDAPQETPAAKRPRKRMKLI